MTPTHTTRNYTFDDPLAADLLFFFFITLTPRVEWYKSL